MSEVLVREVKFTGGDYKLYIDKEKKFARQIWSGKYDAKEAESTSKAAIGDLKSLARAGEYVFMHDASKSEVKLWTSEQAKAAKEGYMFLASYFKKVAVYMTSFTHQKSTESMLGTLPDSLKYFTSEQEAMKFLLG